MKEYATVTLKIEVTPSWQRPDKTDWKKLTAHDGSVEVLDSYFEDELSEDEEAALHVAQLVADKKAPKRAMLRLVK